ncbi:MAG TPA: CaiB/BaiF CoA-transferase family protein [Azospirillaceae bacterium]|nr:CaiB/BaiF CoA-transferase family protein [Azospirillaceae bacterium]
MSEGGRTARGPLDGVRILEMAGIGPGPYCAMLLGDLGADVLRIDRPGGDPNGLPLPPRFDPTRRSRRSVALDLKHPDAVALVLRLVEQADALIEGYRPGVMERLGLGPDACLARNPRLVFGRVTGWGQDGPLAQAAGHDLNYIAVTGALDAIGPADRPVPPLNLIGDYAGGSLFLALGLLAGIIEARRSGRGQVVDAAMVDGAANLMSIFYGMRAAGQWRDQRRSNLLDGGAPFYDTYACADGRFVSVAPLEPKFFRVLAERLGLEAADVEGQWRTGDWPRLRARLVDLFRTRTRDEWAALLEGTDACFAPVMGMDEAPAHPHLAARGTFVDVAGVVQPGPAPRFSRTPAAVSCPPPEPGRDTRTALAAWGVPTETVDALVGSGGLVQA